MRKLAMGSGSRKVEVGALASAQLGSGWVSACAILRWMGIRNRNLKPGKREDKGHTGALIHTLHILRHKGQARRIDEVELRSGLRGLPVRGEADMIIVS